MKHNSFFNKIFLGYVVTIFFITIALFFTAFNVFKNYNHTKVSEFLFSYVNCIKIQIEKNDRFLNDLRESNHLPITSAPSNSYLSLQSFLKEFDNEGKIRVTLINTNGIVLADTHKSKDLMNNHKDRPEISGAFGGVIKEVVRLSPTLGKEMLYVAYPIGSYSTIGVIRVSMEINQIKSDLREFLVQIFIITLLAMCIALFVSFLITRKLFQPVQTLIELTRSVIANKNFSITAPPASTPEIQELSDAFTTMCGEVKTLLHKTNEEKEDMAVLVTSIREAILVVGENGKIIQSNFAFQKMIMQYHIKRKKIRKVFTNPEIYNLIREGLKIRKDFEKEFEFNGSLYLVKVAHLYYKKSAAFVFYDITKDKKLAEEKKMFVSNVSHELKTPLTSIAGYTETLLLKEGDAEKIQFLKIIERNAMRMSGMVNDLLSLAQVEEDKIRWNFTKFPLKELIQTVKMSLDSQVQSKGLNLQLKIEENLELRGDTFLIEQLVRNLIENAIRYSDKGTITITAEKSGDRVTFSVSDEGIGIPQSEIPHLFERFYVVDKSRSRERGGTGLGLSIVNHICKIHKAECHVESEMGKGTVVSVRFRA